MINMNLFLYHVTSHKQANTYFVTWCPPVVGPMYESKTGKNMRP